MPELPCSDTLNKKNNIGDLKFQCEAWICLGFVIFEIGYGIYLNDFSDLKFAKEILDYCITWTIAAEFCPRNRIFATWIEQIILTWEEHSCNSHDNPLNLATDEKCKILRILGLKFAIELHSVQILNPV